MASRNFSAYIIGFLLAGLFLICVFSFYQGVASNYGKTINDIEGLNIIKVKTAVSGTTSDSDLWGSNITTEENPQLEGGEIIFTSIPAVAKLMWSGVIKLFKVVFVAPAQLLGIHPIAIGVVGAIIVITLIVLFWRMIKTGEG